MTFVLKGIYGELVIKLTFQKYISGMDLVQMDTESGEVFSKNKVVKKVRRDLTYTISIIIVNSSCLTAHLSLTYS